MITRTRPKCFAGCQDFALAQLPKRCIARDPSNRFGAPLWDEQPKRNLESLDDSAPFDQT